MRSLLTELVMHEQIHTTVAKAKFVQHEMERLVNIAKRGTKPDLTILTKAMFTPDVSVPKLTRIIAERYRDRVGGYVRILRNGFHAPGSDRAEMAIIEFVGNPKDIVYNLSLKSKPVIEAQLKTIQLQKYTKRTVTLIDPSTGQEHQIEKLAMRNDLDAFTLKRTTRREIVVKQKLRQFVRNDSTFAHARECDEKSREKIMELHEQRLTAIKEAKETKGIPKYEADPIEPAPTGKLLEKLTGLKPIKPKKRGKGRAEIKFLEVEPKILTLKEQERQKLTDYAEHLAKSMNIPPVTKIQEALPINNYRIRTSTVAQASVDMPILPEIDSKAEEKVDDIKPASSFVNRMWNRFGMPNW